MGLESEYFKSGVVTSSTLVQQFCWSANETILIIIYILSKVIVRYHSFILIYVLILVQVMKIKGLESLHEVRITVEQGDRLNRIRVQGPPKNVMAAHERVRAVMQEVLTSKHKEAIGRLVGYMLWFT